VVRFAEDDTGYNNSILALDDKLSWYNKDHPRAGLPSSFPRTELRAFLAAACTACRTRISRRGGDNQPPPARPPA